MSKKINHTMDMEEIDILQNFEKMLEITKEEDHKFYDSYKKVAEVIKKEHEFIRLAVGTRVYEEFKQA